MKYLTLTLATLLLSLWYLQRRLKQALWALAELQRYQNEKRALGIYDELRYR